MSISVTAAEQTLIDRIQILWALQKQESAVESKRPDRVLRLAELGKVGHELHDTLASRGHEPHHTRHLLEGRMMKPSDPNFYANGDALRSLLSFIDPSLMLERI